MERMHTIYDAAAGKAGPPHTRTGTGTARRAAYMAHISCASVGFDLST